MNPISGTLTETNLVKVFVLKSQIINKYEYYAKQAKKDGFEQMSAIFTEVAEQQRNHAKTIFRFLEDCLCKAPVQLNFSAIGNTLENLQDAIRSETEVLALLQEAAMIAWDEDLKKVSTKMKLFMKISESYVGKFGRLVKNIEEDKVFRKDKKVKWICRKCGLIYEGEKALKNCPGCEHPQAYFEVSAENY
jgi:rubrerythrin